MEKFDCVVVGAGLYGLAAAKQFRALNQQSSLAIFEGESSIGGTWAQHRIYPGLKSNNLLGTYEYPDFPMTAEKFGVKVNEHLPGSKIHAYLQAYADHFGISHLIRFNSKVTVAEHMDEDEGGWQLTIRNVRSNQEAHILTRGLIVATGITSEAFLPHFDGQETFRGEVFHGKDFPQHKATLEKGQTVTVFGATKFAWDAVYAYATAGVNVHWVVRSSGHGPCWMTPPYVTPFKKWMEELANTRALTWFSPCVWGHADGYPKIRNFLHGTSPGRLLVELFWKFMEKDVLSLNKYDSHPDTAKLKPWTKAFFTGPSFSINNYDTSIWNVIKSDLVKVYVGEIDHLSDDKVHLADGTELKCDALLAHTGWKHVSCIKFLPEGIETEIGLPHALSQHSADADLGAREPLLQVADEEILTRFPKLRKQPVWNANYIPMTQQKGIKSNDEISPYKPLSSYTLHRFMVPPSERLLRAKDIAFAGVIGNFSNPITAHLQGLWINAYLKGQLDNDPSAAVGNSEAMAKLHYETVLHNRFGKWRYPTDWGTNKTPGFIFDAVPYFDLLQQDLGLSSHRKRGSWTEMWSPYGPRDYMSVNEEWEKKHKE
ncbi:unnamed protein product [Clonostachys chloroleuca]|uniref:Uncharacterized protein n=1 Tax=Clonostachys chloroleuca TaxID=1926264 RepID=A0AA35M9Q8_9HYPO|nr:unnamed protein product [Clonostachys chloroleuca]